MEAHRDRFEPASRERKVRKIFFAANLRKIQAVVRNRCVVQRELTGAGIQGVGILWPEPPNWEVAWLRQDGTKPNPECERLLQPIVSELQARYELALEAQPTPMVKAARR